MLSGRQKLHGKIKPTIINPKRHKRVQCKRDNKNSPTDGQHILWSGEQDKKRNEEEAAHQPDRLTT